MKRQGAFAISLVGVIVLVFPAGAANRNLAIIVDTSRSMEGNDPQRYTMQLSQVLADLADANDDLSVIRMPPDSFLPDCWAGANPSLVLRLDPSNRGQFKRQLDGLIRFDTGTYFGAPIRTAISILSRDPSAQRMLLVIADSGGLGMCESTLSSELQALKRQGVTIAAINLGGASGAFDRNPAFDFTTSALDAQELIGAVALVYQRFLGAKKVQTGRVKDEIRVEIAPFVDEAFLVVASDGPIGGVALEPGNPAAQAIDLNHRGGGATQGLDGVLRSYRIVQLKRPAAGVWRFRGVGLGDRAGWMLLQDVAVGVRLISPSTVAKGVAVPLEAELFDPRTGQRIADPSRLSGLRVDLDVDGRTVAFSDDGTHGDRQAGDGVLTAMTTFDKAGDQPLTIHMQSDLLDRTTNVMAKVIDAAWALEVRSPKRGEVDRPVLLSVRLRSIGTSAPLEVPDRIDVRAGAQLIELRDRGQHVFTGSWTPSDPGTYQLEYVPPPRPPIAKATAPIDIVGRLRFGAPVALGLGRLTSESVVNARLDLTASDVRGNFDLELTTAFHRDRVALEIDLGSGWMPLGKEPQTLRLESRGPRTWPVRVRVGECPEGHSDAKPFPIIVTGVAPDGRPVRTSIPVTVKIVPDSWLHCWWPVLALGAGVAVLATLIHGYWSPSRFPPRLGVMLSPEEDITEGFFHPIRRRSGSGFYRDARVYIGQDFRLSTRPHSAVARLRADRRLVRIEPASGGAVWRQNAEGTWEQIPVDESTVRFGDLYRNDAASLFFELRNS